MRRFTEAPKEREARRDGASGAAGSGAGAHGKARRAAGTTIRSFRASATHGFLLLEAVVALAIIGIVAVGVLASTAAQVRTAGKASVLAVARTLAEDRTTAFRFLGYEELRDPPDSLMGGAFPAPFDEYSWSAAIHETEGEYDLFTLDVVTTGRGEVFPVQTLLHRPRPQIVAGSAAAGRGGAGQGGAGGRGGRGGNVTDAPPGRGGGGAGLPAGGGRGGAGRGGGQGGGRGGE
ncbi:MAG: type II secretion system protein [Gemmatimonadota bacterium]